jgi:tetratricopeptide (TPR) repeat protein
MRTAIIAVCLAAPVAGALAQAGGGDAATAPDAGPNVAETESPPRAGAPAGEDAAPNAAERLAAQSLRRSAEAMFQAPPETPGRAGRVIALSRLAQRFVPHDPRTLRLLADIYESQGRTAAAAAAVAGYLEHYPDDHAQNVRRLRLGVAELHTADERRTFLAAAVARDALPASVRAEAGVMLADVLYGMGDRRGAAEAYRTALAHDPAHGEALHGALALQEDPNAADRVRALLAALRGNPADPQTAITLADLLGGLGLRQQALRFLDHATALAPPATPAERHDLALMDLNLMLDAGRAADAVQEYRGLLSAYPDSGELRALLTEAYRQTGQTRNAEQLVRTMRADYKRRRARGEDPAALEAELAWFHLIVSPNPEAALKHAQEAAKAEPNDPAVTRLLGMAELAGGLPASGAARLKRLAGHDPYAAAYLAEHYARTGRAADAQQLLSEAGETMRHTGPAFRKMLAVSRTYGLELSLLAPGAPRADREAKALPDAVLDLARRPQDHLRIALHPVRSAAAVGQRLEVRGTLTNLGPADLPLGLRGMFSPVLALRVSAKIGDRTKTFSALPLLTWPAPRYLKSGRSVAGSARLDVGPLGEFLNARPFDDVRLRIRGVLDPVQRGERLRSAVPGIPGPRAEIVRRGLLGAFDRSEDELWATRYRRALGRIVWALKRGDLAQRAQAARQVGSLLDLYRRSEEGRALIPRQLWRHVDKPVLLRLMVELLTDPAPVIRAEMLAALTHVAVDEDILRYMADRIQDPSALVRFRAAEVLGCCPLPGQEKVLAFLSRDDDAMVRLMAEAFSKPGAKGGASSD